MRIRHGQISALALVAALAGCAPTSDRAETAASVAPSVTPDASGSPSEEGDAFPTEAFGDIRERPVSEETAATFQAALKKMADGAGMAATVMSADGTWSGAHLGAGEPHSQSGSLTTPNRLAAPVDANGPHLMFDRDQPLTRRTTRSNPDRGGDIKLSVGDLPGGG